MISDIIAILKFVLYLEDQLKNSDRKKTILTSKHERINHENWHTYHRIVAQKMPDLEQESIPKLGLIYLSTTRKNGGIKPPFSILNSF